MWKLLGVIFGLICVGVGLGFFVSTEPLMKMCRTSCWLNGLAYAMFGDQGGKIAMGSIWAVSGFWFIYKCFATRKELHDDHKGP
jgi:hypothetical protein